MVVDASAVVAIPGDEPERRAFNEALESAERCVMSVVSFVEASMVMDARHGPDGRRDLDLLLARAAMELVPVDPDQAYVGRDAFRRYGRGRHPAGLNVGDCFTYALARLSAEAVLCKGADFPRTDIAVVKLGGDGDVDAVHEG